MTCGHVQHEHLTDSKKQTIHFFFMGVECLLVIRVYLKRLLSKFCTQEMLMYVVFLLLEKKGIS